ncbi:MAG: RNA polymerase sigma factor RpoH [Acidiferrobacteraceae bacterium]|jgi:RNA polymerase sigma-32 factor|nr:RNA polymerase sigma factor RpoH [Acidiferrobacteraceae bacterium]MDP6397912.1 RNA polymerase sigma factor RpoH [Arenicellales bacterium]MDP6550862.1 RNA polymerase sigma factor RpoH [Arenicellales bacterium]MDP6790762.1 RNA polymerase sigma factor RpoH [Arenicellales bacterium]MDP6917896.1 RNA polymerase sigma factor RpoH [Arenicellales bacterium]|tara:strand:+ start:26687 stop:27547 length:861 start_codon:yes stop_codon:yes gene_type:complete
MSESLPVATDLGPNQGLARYLNEIKSAPILSAEEEKALARRYHADHDLEAARQLVFSHLRYVVSIARGFTGYGLPLADLIQEGNVGLMKAVKRFDHERDVRLVSFAVHWIKAEIYDYVVRNWRMVKVATTKAQRKLFFNLRKNRARLGMMKQAEVETMAKTLDVKPQTVREMEVRMNGTDVAFEPEADDDDTPRSLAPAEAIGDSSLDPGRLVFEADEQRHRQAQLGKALSSLDDRSREIIRARWLAEEGQKQTLGDLAEKYGVSAERIRQIEKRAMDQMRVAATA